MLLKIISGGQTGVDRAALDVALALGIPHGGWCPRGRLAEDGRIPGRYQLTETESAEYPARTERNVLESDATLVLCRGEPGGGTELTVRLAAAHARPCLVIDLAAPPPAPEVARWLQAGGVETLNIAGPRESQCPGIGKQAGRFLRRVLKRFTAEDAEGRRGRAELAE
jgi:hypothetical protein